MSKLTTSFILLGALAMAQTAYADEPANEQADEQKTDSTFVFTDIKVNPTTSVKDQNKSGTCWCFASTSFIEDEIVRKGGKEYDLSEMFTVRNCYLAKADRYVRLYGQTNFGAGGANGDVMYVFKNFGAIPENAYPGINYGEDKHVHGELDGVLKAYLDVVVRKPNKRISTAWRKGVEAILDTYLGEVPETFEVDGATYTPESFAKHLNINPDDYVNITSFTHHPFYETFAIEVPDNWLWSQSYNVPMLEMKAVVDNAIEKGYPIVWAADVSEGGFKWKEGYALFPKEIDANNLEGTELSRWVHLSDKERADKRFEDLNPYTLDEVDVTQEMRQEMFDRQETTDDHGMEIVGYATDQTGRRFYKVKNSWDTNQIYDGFFYVSEPYFLAKTVCVYLHKDALPKDIAKKLHIK